jgi:four helix bundle protein
MLRVYDDAVAMLKVLKPVIEEIAKRDADLAKQLRRCSSSVVLNIAEGGYARKGNKVALFAVALGSAKETVACLDVADAFGYVAIDDALRARLDSICAVLFKLA